MSTKTEPGPFDGLQRAQPDEPVFTLRAHDPLASRLVLAWVWHRRSAIRRDLNAGKITQAKADLELIQCREAEEIAWAMKDWRSRESGDAAEVEEAKEAAKPTYSGIIKSAEEIAAKVRHDTIKGASSKLNNSVAEITNAADALEPHGFHHERAVILTMASKLKLVSAHIAPKRASFYVGQPLPEPFELKAALVCMNDLRHHQPVAADGE